MLRVQAFDHIVFTVSNVEASASWYETVLGMTRGVAEAPSGGTARVSLIFGRNKINLRPSSADQEDWFTARPPQAGSEDLCFLTDMAPDAVAEHLRTQGISIEQGPVTKKGAVGPICSVYVRDPDGNLIEVSSPC
jgi:catechol 2,3-dioxygenase-like lactoylglutathione lyase family enzyme